MFYYSKTTISQKSALRKPLPRRYQEGTNIGLEMKIKMVHICGKVMRKRASKKHAQKSQNRMLKNASGGPPGGLPDAKIDSEGRFGRDLGFSKLLFFRPGAPLET